MKKCLLTFFTTVFLLTNAIAFASNAINPVADQTLFFETNEKSDLPKLPSTH